MQVLIRSRYFSKEKRALIADLAGWCGKKLLGRLHNNVSVLIRITDPARYSRDKIYGTTELSEDEEDPDRPRDFVITMTGRFEILRSLMIVAHEMVHVKQYARKELGYCGRSGRSKWQGSLVNDDDISYWDLPWEIEAHGREKGLVYQWATERGLYKEKWFKELF